MGGSRKSMKTQMTIGTKLMISVAAMLLMLLPLASTALYSIGALGAELDKSGAVTAKKVDLAGESARLVGASSLAGGDLGLHRGDHLHDAQERGEFAVGGERDDHRRSARAGRESHAGADGGVHARNQRLQR